MSTSSQVDARETETTRIRKRVREESPGFDGNITRKPHHATVQQADYNSVMGGEETHASHSMHQLPTLRPSEARGGAQVGTQGSAYE